MCEQSGNHYSILRRVQRDLDETRRLRALPSLSTLLKKDKEKTDWVDAVIWDVTGLLREDPSAFNGGGSSLLICHMSLSNALGYLQQVDLRSRELQPAQPTFSLKELQRKPVATTQKELKGSPIPVHWSPAQASPMVPQELAGDEPKCVDGANSVSYYQDPARLPDSPPVGLNRLHEHRSVSSISTLSMPSPSCLPGRQRPFVECEPQANLQGHYSSRHRPSTGSESQVSLQEEQEAGGGPRYVPYRPPRYEMDTGIQQTFALTVPEQGLSGKRRRSKAMMDAALGTGP